MVLGHTISLIGILSGARCMHLCLITDSLAGASIEEGWYGLKERPCRHRQAVRRWHPPYDLRCNESRCRVWRRDLAPVQSGIPSSPNWTTEPTSPIQLSPVNLINQIGLKSLSYSSISTKFHVIIKLSIFQLRKMAFLISQSHM